MGHHDRRGAGATDERRRADHDLSGRGTARLGLGAAETYEPGPAWWPLAQASGPDRAIEVAGLFRNTVESLLPFADIRSYRQIATLLIQMRKLPGGDQDAFAAYVADIKHRFARRPTFIKALRDKGL